MRRVLVVGAGPAGVACAERLSAHGVPFDWVDGSGSVGGALAAVHNRVEDWPPGDYESGAAVAASLSAWARARQITPADQRVSGLSRAGDRWKASLGDGTTEFGAVVLATGARHRVLGVPGEAEGLAEGWISHSATRDALETAGRDVVIVGGGDAAVEGALILARAGAASVRLVARSALRARAQLRNQLAEHPQISMHPVPANVVSFDTSTTPAVVHLDDGTSWAAQMAFVRIGVRPVLPRISPAPATDSAGFLKVDGAQASSLPALFGAGDVTNAAVRSIANAVASGARAALSAARHLEVI